MFMKYLILSLPLILSACFKSDPEFAIGDCVNPVDGSQIWKLTENTKDKLEGVLLVEKVWSTDKVVLPNRIFAKVPCPNVAGT